MRRTTEKKYASIAFAFLMTAVLLLGMVSPAFAVEKVSMPIADLNGKTIGVQTGCLYETHITDECPAAW